MVNKRLEKMTTNYIKGVMVIIIFCRLLGLILLQTLHLAKTINTVKEVLYLLTRWLLLLQSPSLECAHLILRYFLLTLQSFMKFYNFKSPLFSFQGNPAAIFNGLNPLVETDER